MRTMFCAIVVKKNGGGGEIRTRVHRELEDNVYTLSPFITYFRLTRSTGDGRTTRWFFAIMSVIQAIKSPLCQEATTMVDRMSSGGQERSSSAQPAYAVSLRAGRTQKILSFASSFSPCL